MWYDSIISAILRSPLHGLLSSGIMLLTVRGRKSGRTISTPVSYFRQDNWLWVISSRKRKWWRNLLGGAPVTLRIAGRTVKGHGDAILDETKVAAHIEELLPEHPVLARYLDLHMDGDKPNDDDLTRAAQSRLLVRIHQQDH